MAIYCPKQSNYKKAGYGNGVFRYAPEKRNRRGKSGHPLEVHGGRTRDASDAILNYRAHFIEMRPETRNLKPET